MKRILFLFVMMHACIFAYSQKTENNGWHVKNYTEAIAKAYFDSRYSLDLIEGIWQSSDGFKYSIEKDVENGQRTKDKYRVIVLESSYNGWNPTEIKGFITYSSVNGVYSLKYYTKDEKGENISSQNVLMLAENPLLVSFNRIDGGKISLFKLYPKTSATPPNENGLHSDVIETWSGSSIVIGSRYLATNYHVVDGAKTLAISGSLDNYSVNYRTEVIATDEAIDLAILKVTDPAFKGFENPKYGIMTNTADVGTDIFVLGYPLTSTMGSEVKLTTGVISSKTGFQGDVSIYQISAPIQPGNSGGPLFDGNGNLIGIVNAKHNGAENVGYAIKLTYLKNLIESCNDKIEFNYKNTISGLSLSDKVKVITPCVYIVRANYLSCDGDNINNITGNKPQIDDKSSAQEYYAAARQMYEDKRYEEAYDLAKKSVATSPNKENHYLRAWLGFYIAKDYDIVIESAKYCIEEQYNQESSLELLGASYYSLAKWTDSIDAYTKGLLYNRKNVGALFMRGLCKANNGDTEAALIDYKSALKFEGLIDFDYDRVYNQIAYQQLCLGDLTNAQTNISQAIKRNHFYGNNWDTYGELMYKLGKYQECVRYMGAAITCAIGDENAWTKNSYYYRGLANKRLGYDADALEDLQRAKELGKEEADSVLCNDFVNNNYNSGKFFNIYNSPTIEHNSTRNLRIRAIESSEEYTKIHFIVSYTGGGWYNINKDAYIEDATNAGKLYIIKAENIAFSPEKTTIGNEIAEFSLTFPAISSSCTSINFVEGTDGWKMTGIGLDSYSEVKINESSKIHWKDVVVTDDSNYANGLEAVANISKFSGWGGLMEKLGLENAIKMIQKEAARRGCCMAIITNVDNSFGVSITATLYKRP